MEKYDEHNSVIIACSMLEGEIKISAEKSGNKIPIIWMEKSLHEEPEKLRAALQEEIDKHQDKQWIFLIYALCGNAVLGLKSPKTTLVIPKFDDCIRMLLSMKPGCPIENNPRCLYFTDSWVDSERFILKDANKYIEKYGEKKGRKILKIMLANYTDLKLIDSGAYDVRTTAVEMQKTACALELAYGETKGTMRVLDKLFAGQWDGEFCVINPGETVAEKHFEGRPRCVEGVDDGRTE